MGHRSVKSRTRWTSDARTENGVDWGSFGIIVTLLAVSLVALLLVQVARREAGAIRAQATADVEHIRADARAELAEVERRELRLGDREAAVAAARSEIAELERAARAASDEAARSQRAAERTLDSAERAAARTVADAERLAAQRIASAQEQAMVELAQVAGLTRAEALDALTARLVAEAENAAAAKVRRAEAQARRSSDAKALRVLTTSVQRLAVSTSAQSSVTQLALPSDEMKGRIIGKEGRNIRSFEALTGVNVLVDETPDTVVLSSFDAERREVAAAALTALMLDGRINPQRIEVAYAQALAEVADRDEEAGHDAAERAGVGALDPELVRTLGRLRLRTSSGQNVLEHLVETSLIAAAIAAELGADVEVTRRGAFLHDIGKALTPLQGGSHARAGADLVRRFGERQAVVDAVAAHHDEVPPSTVEAVLVQVADAISAARPGARRESTDQFVERMERLEALVGAHAGVRRVLAMAAGREVRVVVEPDQVSDVELPGLADRLARAIEAESDVPGEIRVTVVRELRASATTG
ncbi:MAG: ribonuclease Y [Actinobacteria bacterium]|nr:ribonuclease Y [Actinomycetota bacterium]